MKSSYEDETHHYGCTLARHRLMSFSFLAYFMLYSFSSRNDRKGRGIRDGNVKALPE
jgi:hypothetical protein